MSDKVKSIQEISDAIHQGLKITWLEVARIFKPDISEEKVDYILWNETCYPFDDETTLKQLIKFIKTL